MRSFSFELIIHGNTYPDSTVIDRLFEAGCSDGIVSMCDTVLSIAFDREAESEKWAIATAIMDVERVGLRVSFVQVEGHRLKPRPGCPWVLTLR